MMEKYYFYTKLSKVLLTAVLPLSVIRRANQLLLKFEKDSKKSNKEAFIGESQNLNLFEAKDT